MSLLSPTNKTRDGESENNEERTIYVRETLKLFDVSP